MNIEINIKEARINADLTQAEAAQVLRVSKRSIESWEAGITNPKIPEEKIMEAYGIAGMLNSEARQAFLAGELDYDEMAREYKIQVAKRQSVWGRYPDTFNAILARVPESVFNALTGGQLAELIDTLQEAYNDGKMKGESK